MLKPIIFSGSQPSGIIHLGNYFGAIKQWMKYQDEARSYFCIVDLHALTVRQDPEILREKIKQTAALYLACGIDPEKSTVFVQSQVPAHSELAWILNCYTQLGELERMTQFKDKAKKNKQNINVGLLAYPVLMAADILLYQTELVPVGEDQKQHVELTRNIAQRFNNSYENIFTLPKPVILQEGGRIMGLDDPAKKMSKSAASEYNYISLTDKPDQVRKKIMKAVTDSGSVIKLEPLKNPAISNLLVIYLGVTGETKDKVEQKYRGKGYGEFKEDLAEALIEFLQPLQNRYNEFLSNEKYLDEILAKGAAQAQTAAGKTLTKVRETLGLG